jgi:phosphatidylethanolamine/phosphatidyl-N-methylethanolamine N-methyltransferase
MPADASVFFTLWLQKPLCIAAVNPSGAHLAAAIAAQVDLARPGLVLELGAGTGSLTRPPGYTRDGPSLLSPGVIRAGCPPGRIIALEREPALARILRRNLPGVMVIEDDAVRIRRHPAMRAQQLSTVVSSLPIRWFSPTEQAAVVRPCLERLGPAGRFVQITNGLRSPLLMEELGVIGCEVARVWFNLLPARVWCYWDRTRSLRGGEAI